MRINKHVNRSLNELDLHITNRCTLRCKTCCFDSGEKVFSELPKESVAIILRDAVALGCQELHITGGEPLLRSDLEEIIAIAHNLKMDVRLQTNGTLLTQKRIESLLDVGLKRLMISLDSSCRELNDSLRGKGAYDAAINAIDLSINAGLHVRVNAVLTKLNIQVFPKLVELCSIHGVKQVSGFYFSPIGRGRRNMDLWIEPKDYIHQYLSIEKQLLMMTGNVIPIDMDIVIERAYSAWDDASQIDVSNFSGCGGGCVRATQRRDYVIIRSDGNIYPCILMVEWDKSLGNVTELNLKHIWQNDDGWKILDRRQAVEVCVDCSHLSLCQAGCTGYARLIQGAAHSPDPRCNRGSIVPLCPIMKYNVKTKEFGGSSEDVLTNEASPHSVNEGTDSGDA